MRRVLAVLALVVGLSGFFAAAATPASAIPISVNGQVVGDTDDVERVCLHLYVRLFGNVIVPATEVCTP